MKPAAESKVFSRNYSLNIGGRLIDLTTPRIMGILNVTTDSFYTASRAFDEVEILTKAGKMLEDGATFLDVGGASTRPGAPEVAEEEELKRVRIAIAAIKREFPSSIISCDTFRSEVARQAVYAGADLMNDVSGGERDAAMFKVISELRVPYILMHSRGTPETMGSLTQYDNLMMELISWLQERVLRLRDAGVKDVIVDPGFGFAKSQKQGFELLRKLELLHVLECPLLVGISRKSMIWKTLKVTPDEALNGTTVLHTLALMKGASILRVHDVKEAVEAVTLIAKCEKL